MRKLYYIILFSFFSKVITGQVNLVPNPSFESYTACPTAVNDLSPDALQYLGNWFSGLATPDYFNSCAAISSNVNSPSNICGYREPFDGNAYCGFAAYTSTSEREVISSPLTSQMSIGSKYYISMKVALAGNYVNNCCGLSKIGFKFSKYKYNTSDYSSINNSAHILTSAFVTDTTNWSLINGVFIADSSYNYVNIGHFFDNANTNSISVNPNSSIAYYYIDDVRVSTDSLFGYSVGLHEQSSNSQFSINPNPSSGIFRVKTDLKNITYKIYNSFGQIILMNETSAANEFDISDFHEGIYFISIKNNNVNHTRKIILQKNN